ncbi:hypothetical protein [Haloparvum sedimenti]|uniref:hypothetical protein n=1 Tax=Haloparvum sedimenti TaxID=1678448 RepID=UPI00071E7BCD|nr:hypothetical protein [Haloparvum sedimenti]
MIDFQEDVLNDGHVCNNCMGRLRRRASRPVRYRNADVDEKQNRVQEEGVFIASYSERLRWRTTVDDVPDVPVRDQHQTFCECGSPDAFTRIWDDADVDAARLRDLVVNLYDTLVAKGYTVDARQLARGADEIYHQLPPASAAGRGIGPAREDTPTTINEVLAGAADAGVLEAPSTEAPA